MLELLIAVTVLSLLHALIPSHWAPIIAVARAEGWSCRETAWVTLAAGLGHALSTVLIGVLLGLAGLKLSARFTVLTHLLTPLVLVVMGLIYAGLGHVHVHEAAPQPARSRGSKVGLVIGLAGAMFLSPCLEIGPLYLSAGALGGRALLLLSAVYVCITLGGMLVVVQVGRHGIDRLRWHWLEHYERKLTGGTLVLLGILSYYIRF